MRICLLSKEFPPDTGWGGIGAYNYQIAHGLKEIGHDVEVVSLASENVVRKQNRSNIATAEEDGITVHRVAWNKYMDDYRGMLLTVPTSHFMIKTNMLLWSAFLEAHTRSKFDVVEAPEHLAEGLFPALTKMLPVVIKLHTPWSKFLSERFHNITPTFDHQFIAMLERLAMVTADALISPSSDIAAHVSQDINYPFDAIHLVKNPIDANTFCPEGSRAIEHDGRPTILFVGRLEERKGIRYLIDAVPRIVQAQPNVRIVIIGSDTKTASGHAHVLPQLKESLLRSGCSQSVTFVPHVPLSEMPSYYRSADICIAPSLYDNAPYTCLEAMAAGKAFIGTDAGGMPEYIEHGHSGIIIPAGCSDSIVAAVASLLQDEHMRHSLGQKAREYILKNVHRTEIARRNIMIYELASQNFQAKKDKALYKRDHANFLADASALLTCYETMLYDLLYVHSWRFRLRHKFWQVASCPQYFLERLISGFSCILQGRKPPSVNENLYASRERGKFKIKL